jgi:Concanavalin A-like lectin/glucanases superfamily
LSAGLWIHVVGVADGTRRNIYRDGILKYSDVYAGKIIPIHGAAPMRLGTRDLKSFFMGEMREVRVWNRALTATEVPALHDSGIVPSDGLVAEYLLTQDIAVDTAGAHHGSIVGATWVAQDS